MSVSTRIEVGRLADQLERSFHGGAWHGPAVREALARIDAATAVQRPEGSPHSILDLVRHITFWVDAARLRIAEGRDVNPEDDWTDADGPAEQAWATACASLDKAAAGLLAVVKDLEDECLDDAVPGCDPSIRGLLLGTLQHSAYHTGQIIQLAREINA